MTRVVLAFVVGICGPSVTASAQATLPIAVDERVRVWTSSQEAITGRVASMAADGFEVANQGTAPVRVARSAVTKIDVSRGVTSTGAGAKKGAFWGADHLGRGRRGPVGTA